MRLARWPAQLPSAQEVQVQVIDGLRPVFAVVDDNAVAIGQAEVSRDPFSDDQQVTEERLVLLARLRELSDRLSRNDKKMRWCLGANVMEGNALQKIITFIVYFCYRCSRFETN